MLHKNIFFGSGVCDWRFEFGKAEGSYIWDRSGRKILDFTSGWNVCNLGWNHPEISSAMIEQIKKTTYSPMWTSEETQEELAEKLTGALPNGLEVVARATGGTEANEEALKTARAFTGRKKIIGFKNTYHGQSFGTMAIGYLPEYVEKIEPLVGNFIQIDFPDIFHSELSPEGLLNQFSIDLEACLKNEDVAAIICEAGIITGWGSAAIAPSGFTKIIRELTNRYGTLWILDEVGTGFSRCGKLFGMQIEGETPDIATFAKGMSNGASAIGAMITTKEIAEATIGDTNLTSTFGWNPVSCAAAARTLEIHKRDRIWEKSDSGGKFVIDYLNNKLDGNPFIKSIRGLGMELAIEFNTSPKQTHEIIKKAFEKGLLLAWDEEFEKTIEIMPPLTINEDDLKRGLDVLIESIKEIT